VFDCLGTGRLGVWLSGDWEAWCLTVVGLGGVVFDCLGTGRRGV